MPSSADFLSDDRINDAREAARLILGHAHLSDRLETPLRTLSDFGHDVVRSLDREAYEESLRIVQTQITYHTGGRGGIVQTFIPPAFEEIPVLLPLDDAFEEGPAYQNPFARTHKGLRSPTPEDNVRTLMHIKALRTRRISDQAFVIMPELFKMAAFWIREINADVLSIQYAASKPPKQDRRAISPILFIPKGHT